MSRLLLLEAKAKTLYIALEAGKLDLNELKHFLKLASRHEEERTYTAEEISYNKYMQTIERACQRRLAKRQKAEALKAANTK